MTAPTVLGLDAAKQHLRVDSDDDDDLIEALIAAAVDHVERFTGLTLEPREVVEAVAGFGGRLTTWPVRQITSIGYRDAAGVEQQLVAGTWWANLTARPLRLNPTATGWPGLAAGAAPVTVTMQAGFEEGQAPGGIVQALKMLVQYFYEDRAGEVDPPAPVAVLLRPHRLEQV